MKIQIIQQAERRIEIEIPDDTPPERLKSAAHNTFMMLEEKHFTEWEFLDQDYYARAEGDDFSEELLVDGVYYSKI